MYNSYNATLRIPYLLINDHKEHDRQAKSDNKNLGKMAKKNFSARFQLGN